MTTNNETQKLDIVEHNFAAFAKELELKVLDGWAISKSNPGDVVGMYGGTFTVSLYRNADTIQRFHDAAEGVQAVPKLSRGEALAKARQAKADKKITNNS